MKLPALFLVFSLSTLVVFGQTDKAVNSPAVQLVPEISLGGKTVALGMAKDRIVTMLASVYRVEPAGSEDWWGVDSKPPYTPATPYTPIASLGFESDKLVFVSKRLFQANRELTGPAFARGFQAVVTQFVAEEGSPDVLGNNQPTASCFIWTESADFPESEDKRIVMQCGVKLLVMEWSRANGNAATGGELEDVTIDENIGTLPKTLRQKN